jgi:hypothetical protein
LHCPWIEDKLQGEREPPQTSATELPAVYVLAIDSADLTPPERIQCTN